MQTKYDGTPVHIKLPKNGVFNVSERPGIRNLFIDKKQVFPLKFVSLKAALAVV
jgi:hypothetical protein